ncbi:hypothetical protein OKW43_005163 [Paraburkholderia sp. WC7.3g]|uniref:SIR2 family protein n=1 Tax=Paraburkholderia sp. WC7.3g TaxID=2991070 RepID=UPI003D19FC8A
MLDSIDALAFEIQAGKGMFALLLGSGISRTAKIPTGWDITLDLIRQVAALKGANPEPDPEKWYGETFEKAPDYSDLLDLLATTQTLRQQVVRSYIEPSDEERSRGEKRPTAAHRAIADLMAKGYVRVVVTTNFDQLLEQALSEAGVTPTIIASADHVAGALPLVHAGPTIVKVHGDYLDTRIRNTVAELSSYDPALDKLLDRIFDEFGLIVCGWSGEWDIALKAAIDRAPSRRFPMYWASRGEPGASAKLLLSRRAGRLVQIDGADEFFEALEHRVLAVETIRQPHPLSVDIAVTMLKEYLPEERHQIRLYDLLTGEFNRTLERLNSLQFDLSSVDAKEAARQASQYALATQPLVALAFTAGMWSNDRQAEQWLTFIVELANRGNRLSGTPALIRLRLLPASIVFYAFCFGAIVGRRLPLVGKLAGKMVILNSEKTVLGDALNVYAVISDGTDFLKQLPEYANKRLPESDLIAKSLRLVSGQVLRESGEFEHAFARLEMALAFGYAERAIDQNFFWVPPGLYLLNRSLRLSITDAWREDFNRYEFQSDLSVMGALTRKPDFDTVSAFMNKVRL